MSNGKFNWSIKTKITVMALALTVIIASVSLYMLRNVVKEYEASTIEQFRSSSDALADAIAAQYYERYGDVQAFALNPILLSKNKSEAVAMLNNYAVLYGIYDLIMVVDTNGKLIAVNNKSPANQDIKSEALYNEDFSKEPWFTNVMQEKYTDDKEKNFAGTLSEDVQIDKWNSLVYGGQRLGTTFSSPIKDATGKIIAVVTNRAGSRWFEVAFKEVLNQLHNLGYDKSEAMLLAGDGTILYELTQENMSKEGKTDIYDFNRLLKVNLAKEGDEAASAVIQGKSGSMVLFDKAAQDDKLVGYSHINSAKIPKGMVWNVLARESASEAFAGVYAIQKLLYFIMGVCLFLASATGYLLSRSLSSQLIAISNSLSKGSSRVTSQAKSLSDVSTKLSEAATEQAASLQETVSSVDEISAMVSKNAEGAERSAQTSGASTKAATKGKQTVENMIHSINDISASNDEIMSQMMQSNREFSEIVTVISEIGNKTKVINDIVFQTKLLSFNASVEAARAGEHGKGFAVVAEEVGNLAAMSGKAAKEISDMLGDSIKKVTSIVDNTKIKVENLVRQGKDKIQVGTLTARECGQALDEILNNVSSVNSLVNEISVASNEQAHGIQEVTKAMSQLDQVTQQNTAVANESSVMSAQLNKQAEDLTGIIQQLLMIVEGKENVSVNTNHYVKSEESNNGNVVRMPKQQKSNGASMKKAVGQSNVPDRDDDRFEDV